MKTVIRLFAILALAAAIVGTVFWYSRPKKPATFVADRIKVHFTCDTAGRLEPCGCFTGQHGGLTRLSTWLGKHGQSGPVLNLDVGGAIAGTADYDLIQYDYLARAYQTMGFAALNMGGREAMIPAANLISLAEKSPVPLISASLVDSQTRKEILAPYRIVVAEGLRIGILGVVSPDSVPNPGEGLAILGMNEAIDRHLPELAAKSDLVILLAFATEKEMRGLAASYYEFSLILGGNVLGPTQEILRENDSIILYTTNQARSVGTLTATVAGDKRKRLVDPAYQIQLLEETIPQNPDLMSMVRDYRTEIRKTPLAIDDPHAVDPNAIPGVSASGTFVGSASCKDCHAAAHHVWQGSAHAKAFETLVKRGSDADPHCIKCHTVGFGQPSGYRRPLGSDSLVDVGCESCHGPASEHLDKVLHGKPVTFKFRPLGPGDCMTCHQGEFSRPFDWETFWPRIAHGKESGIGK